MDYLKNEVDDWQKVVEIWSKTITERQKLFQNKSTKEIFDMFPCLSQPLVGELVRILNLLFYISMYQYCIIIIHNR